MTDTSSMHEAGQSNLVFWDNPEGLGGERAERWIQDVGIHVHPWLIQVNVWQKSPQYCKVISLQIK